jgi:FMN-dependent NADH-azoreductase
MASLLHIDSSPMGAASITRHLSSMFVENWKKANPGGTVVSRDLTTSGLVLVTAERVGAAYTPEESRTEEQKALLALSDELLAELEAADELVVGVPMHNFGIPSVMNLWLDQIVRVGKTFVYVDGTPKGLLAGKKATFLVASGGGYGPGSGLEAMNFVEPYLKTVFGFMGISASVFHTAGGVAALRFGLDRAEFLQPHEEAVAALAAAGA